MRFNQPDSVVPGEQGIYSPLIADYHETQFLVQLNEENRIRHSGLATNLPPVPTNVHSFDRYSYGSNNPIKYVDPSGHCFGYAGGVDTAVCTAFAAAGPPGWIADAVIIVIGLVVVGTVAVIATDAYSEQREDTTNNSGSSANISQKDSLPTVGELPYVPPKQKGKSVPIPVPGGGFRDANGNIWKRDHSGHYRGPHWDVQHPDGSHTNVDDNGKIISEIIPLQQYWGPR
jgi:Bacterial toxin 37